MGWLPIVLGAYFLLALAATFDKFLLKKSIPDPRVYAFFVALLGLLVFLLAPFGIEAPSARLLLLSLLTGICFVIALVSLYTALKRNEISRVIPLVGGLQPVIIFTLSYFLLDERLSVRQIVAFSLLVLGGIVISYGHSKRKGKTRQNWLPYALVASLAFGIFYVLTKVIFLEESFINGLIWPRAGAFVAALALLAWPAARKSIKKTRKTATGGSPYVFLGGQAAGAIGFVLINYAISIASVSLVNALQGAQYVFVFLLAVIISIWLPKIFKEELKISVVVQKVVSIAIIVLGIYLLY